LEPTIEAPKNSKKYKRRGHAKKNIENTSNNKANGHKITGIGAIRNNAADKFTHGIRKIKDSSQQAYVAFGKPKIMGHIEHRKGKALASKIKENVTQENGIAYAQTPVSVTVVDLRRALDYWLIRSGL
jgi:hypothetical protein